MEVLKNAESVKILCIQLKKKKPDLKSVGLFPAISGVDQSTTDLLYFLTFLVFLYVCTKKHHLEGKKKLLQF